MKEKVCICLDSLGDYNLDKARHGKVEYPDNIRSYVHVCQLQNPIFN